MKYMTNLNFCLPTSDEWQFAFKGGNKSRGYKYSGSNIVSDVAWYSGNSNGETHGVKQLQPNELGFYDMSGNIAELILDYSSHYLGGSYNFSEAFCVYNAAVTNRYVDYEKSTGFRIALKP